MQNNLLSIFKAITPDNIKDIPVIDDSMRIFIELLNEYSPISSDIKVALSEETTASIEEELQKIYLYDYYSMINNIKTNKVIVDKFKSWNEALKPSLYPKGLPYIGNKLLVNYFMIGEPGGVLTSNGSGSGEIDINLFPLAEKLSTLEHNILQNNAENYFINRRFKESKGLKKSVQFIYDILNEHIVNPDERLELNFQETGNPFELEISGSIDRDIYRESVAYLSHPLGFVYNYSYISELRFEDNYSLIKTYKMNTIEVRCLSGGVEVYTKDVVNIIERDNYLKIIFNDNFYLLQENDIVRYFNNSDELVKIYPASKHCSIYLDYEIIYKSTLTDSIEFKMGVDLEADLVPDVVESLGFYESLEFKNSFIIGVSTIGTDLISDTAEYIDSTKIIDELGGADILNSEENYNVSDVFEEFSMNGLIFRNNFMIGTSIIGEALISNVPDQVENVTYFDSIADSLKSDELYNVSDTTEDFNIEII